MRKLVFVTNKIGSDNWVQLYFNDELISELAFPWSSLEPLAEEIIKNGMLVEIEYVTDDEMADYSN